MKGFFSRSASIAVMVGFFVGFSGPGPGLWAGTGGDAETGMVEITASDWSAQQARIEELERQVRELRAGIERFPASDPFGCYRWNKDLELIKLESVAGRRVMWRQFEARRPTPPRKTGPADPPLRKFWPRLEKESPYFIRLWSMLVPGFGPASMTRRGTSDFKFVVEEPLERFDLDEYLENESFDFRPAPNGKIFIYLNGGDDCSMMSLWDRGAGVVRYFNKCGGAASRIDGFWLSNTSFVVIQKGLINDENNHYQWVPVIHLYDLFKFQVTTWIGPAADSDEHNLLENDYHYLRFHEDQEGAGR